jgi:hypothetical protein
MSVVARCRLLAALLLFGSLQGACRSRSCPPVDCRPEIAFKFRQPLAEPYHLLVSLRGLTFETDCPFPWAPQSVGIASCTGQGFAVHGVDLGKDTNQAVELMVGLHLGEPFPATAKLDGIRNSRNCPLVCYQHSGTISN